jgi:hypothetical protein
MRRPQVHIPTAAGGTSIGARAAIGAVASED